MTVKSFKVGGMAFSLGDGQSMPHMSRAIAAEVVKVGRKYVTVLLNGQEVRFYTPYNCGPYLMEDKDWGVPRLLFPTSEAADRYREREELKSWVAEETGCLKIDRYSLEQLRGVKQILERMRPEEHPLTSCDGYQKLPQKAPLILQPKDWAPSEWTTLCRVCGLPADRTAEIKLHVSEIEYFLNPCNEMSSPGPASGPMTEEEMSTFKAFFSRYCRQEINAGHCDDNSCEFCSIDRAYDKIFNGPSDGDEEDDDNE